MTGHDTMGLPVSKLTSRLSLCPPIKPDGTSDHATLLLFRLDDPEDSIWNKFEEEDEKWEGDNSGLL